MSDERVFSFKRLVDGSFLVHDAISGDVLGRVEKRKTTKTGFRHGRCVGQVPCVRWFSIDANGREATANIFGSRGEATRSRAALRLAMEKEPPRG